ncbi:hypothetical protein [Spiroplasma endosymbiont of Diplazon laetatorius]|uniref:hypothetical protein n=1 Tax=Spiroplasma endosymbiont of Diplazon laetatorius TaxID=3066322 RepID=UPI0030CDE540
MKKLLSMISIVVLGVNTLPTVSNAVLIESNNVKQENNLQNYNRSISEYATIDLNDVELEKTSINVSKYEEHLNNDEEMLQIILTELTKVNRKNKVLPQVIKSTKKDYDNWIVILPQFPTKDGEKIVDDLWMMYIGDDNAFEGYLIVEDLELNYESTIKKKELSEGIKNTHLGEVKKLNEETIKREIIKRNDQLISEEDFYIETITYEGAIVKATEKSKFTGSVMVTFDDVFGSIGDIQTDPARSDAYNSEQSSTKTAVTYIDVDLGKSEFLKTYSYMDYTLTTNYYTQAMGRFNYVVNEKNPVAKSETYKDKNHYKPKYQRIYLNENTSISTFDLLYKNVNQERAYGTLTVTWLNDFKIEIKATVNTYAWATAWNAQWARSEAKMGVSDIKFS